MCRRPSLTPKRTKKKNFWDLAIMLHWSSLSNKFSNLTCQLEFRSVESYQDLSTVQKKSHKFSSENTKKSNLLLKSRWLPAVYLVLILGCVGILKKKGDKTPWFCVLNFWRESYIYLRLQHTRYWEIFEQFFGSSSSSSTTSVVVDGLQYYLL